MEVVTALAVVSVAQMHRSQITTKSKPLHFIISKLPWYLNVYLATATSPLSATPICVLFLAGVAALGARHAVQCSKAGAFKEEVSRLSNFEEGHKSALGDLQRETRKNEIFLADIQVKTTMHVHQSCDARGSVLR